MKYEAYEWVNKFTALKNHYICELSSYYQHILPLILAETEANSIKIFKFMAQSERFISIHFGLFRDELVTIKEQLPLKNEPDYIFLAILREIAILAVCDHPHISKIFAVYFNP